MVESDDGFMAVSIDGQLPDSAETASTAASRAAATASSPFGCDGPSSDYRELI